jgi:hypothetical protein
MHFYVDADGFEGTGRQKDWVKIQLITYQLQA